MANLTLETLLVRLTAAVPAQQRQLDTAWRAAMCDYARVVGTTDSDALRQLAAALAPQRMCVARTRVDVTALAARASTSGFTLNLSLVNLGLHRRLARDSRTALRLGIDVAARPHSPVSTRVEEQ